MNFLKKYLFIFGCTRYSLLHELFSSCSEQDQPFNCHMQASYCHGLSCCRAQALGHAGFSSCSMQTQQLLPSGSRAQVQQLWHRGLVTLWNVGSSQIRDRTCVSCLGRQVLYHWATREALNLYNFIFNNGSFKNQLLKLCKIQQSTIAI